MGIRFNNISMEADDIFKVLSDLNIAYKKQEHKAIFCEKDGLDVVITLSGIGVKNLFLKDKDNNYALVSMYKHQKADLKTIAGILGFGRLSFCSPDELKTFLNITPGSVTPLCLMFDTEKKVKVLFDKAFEGQNVVIHPLRNTASISISFYDLTRFVEHFNHSWMTGVFY